MHSAEYRRLRAPQAAQRLGLSNSTLAKLRMSGLGPRYMKLGRCVVYDLADLDTWAASRKRASTSEQSQAA
ncbi:MAG: helix-turn-helix domain-containing protein [Planctomycetes bacterium]|nr:helix-turn-helix domain-containing protein [Planctomycetota bacterium]